MRLPLAPCDEPGLAALGEQARSLLMRRDYAGLAGQFGYALALGRDPAAALEADVARAAAASMPGEPEPQAAIAVRYFPANAAGLFAVVACHVPVADGRTVLLELVVTGSRNARTITIEDVSAGPGVPAGGAG